MGRMSDLHIQMIEELGEDPSIKDVDEWLHLYLLAQYRKKNSEQVKAFLDSREEVPTLSSEKSNERNSKSNK